MLFSLTCSHAKAKPYMTKEHLTKFINEKQRDPRLNSLLFPPARPDQVQSLIEKYEPSGINVQRGEDPGGPLPPCGPVRLWQLGSALTVVPCPQASCHLRAWCGFSVGRRTACWPRTSCCCTTT